ncbi:MULTISPECIES: oxidoreductase [unclassified Luteococcus]|uniref:oxidoreductase n=1 Tax=unclassified Luteococcus TaxID=2639923 RepID=UPI00313C8262
MTEKSEWAPSQIPSMAGRHAVVTGADHGLGLEIATQLVSHGCAVTMLGNQPERARAARASLATQHPHAWVDVEFVDLADLDSVGACGARLVAQGRPINLLVNNAGVMMLPYATTEQGFERHFGINHLGHFALTGRLLPLLVETPHSRVVTMASNGHKMPGLSFDDVRSGVDYKAMRAYGRSKLANLLFSQELARRLAAHGHQTLSVAAHPGQSATNPGGKRGLRALVDRLVGQGVARGAEPALRAATDPTVQAGDYYGPDGPGELRGPATKVKPSRVALDPELAAELWRRSEDWSGLSYLD